MLRSIQGYLLDRITQRWVQFTGRKVNLEEDVWLAGPIGNPTGIGEDYFQNLARQQRWEVKLNVTRTGLLQDFNALRSASFDPGTIVPEVRSFYENTSNYELDAWSEWCGVFRPLGWLLAILFSRRLQQLNVPLSSLDTSRGMTSDILQLVDPDSGHVYLTAWLRRLLSSGNVLYAGAYSTCKVPGYLGTCVKVVFPLPNGNAIVIMRPVAHPDGSFSVISEGIGFGDSGFYFTVHSVRDVRVRYVRQMRESIHVYMGEQGTVRADHVLKIFGITFLRLHYRLRLRSQLPTVPSHQTASA